MPKDLKANLEWRRKTLRDAAKDSDFAAELWKMCARDVLFYINGFVWTHDPRVKPSVLPFITFEFQDEALLAMGRALGNHDLAVEKSRDKGATWMFLAVVHHRFVFHHMETYLLVSRKQDLVDKAGDPDCLFWRFDFMTDNLPSFLRPTETRRVQLHRGNKTTGTTVDGSATTGDIARGGRRTAILIDEYAAFGIAAGYEALASSFSATDCRFFNSTHGGTHTAFHEVTRGEAQAPVVLRLMWWDDPRHNVDLYTDAEGKKRSPWYDLQCRRLGQVKALIARELDCDPAGSGELWFDDGSLRAYEAEVCCEPKRIGNLEFTTDSLEPERFRERANGPLSIWIDLEEQADGPPRVPPGRSFLAFADISDGTGASNSAVCFYDRDSKTKVAEWVASTVTPERFAPIVVALCRWFNGAYLGWEANGSGRAFGRTVTDARYMNIYYRSEDKKLGNKKTSFPGWWSSKDSKRDLFTEYRAALADRKIYNLSKVAVNECREYTSTPDSVPVHSKSIKTARSALGSEGHGDIVVADAGCCWLMRDRPFVKPERPKTMPMNCFAARRAFRLEAARAGELRGWL